LKKILHVAVIYDAMRSWRRIPATVS